MHSIIRINKVNVDLTMSPFGPAGPAGPRGPSIPCKEERSYGEFYVISLYWYFKNKVDFPNKRWKAKMFSIHIFRIFPSGFAKNQHTEHVHWPQRTFTTLLTVNVWACVNAELMQHGTKRTAFWTVAILRIKLSVAWFNSGAKMYNSLYNFSFTINTI